MDLDRPWNPCTGGLTVEQHLAQLRFPLTRTYYCARRTQLASCGIPPTEVASNTQLQILMYIKAMLDASNTTLNVSDQTNAALLPPLPDDNAVFQAIHLASTVQTEGCLIASALDREQRSSLYNSTWQDMLLSFAHDRSASCLEDSHAVSNGQAGAPQQHVSCFGKFIWGDAYEWLPEKLFMRYRHFEVQLAWRMHCTPAMPSTPSTPSFYTDVQLTTTYPATVSLSPLPDDRLDPALNAVDRRHLRRPRLATVAHHYTGEHCRATSSLSESDTTASSSSSDASLLATPNVEAHSSPWVAASPAMSCDAAALASPFPTYVHDDASTTSLNQPHVFAHLSQLGDSQITVVRELCDSSVPDGGRSGLARPAPRRRAASKESPKRVIQNREKSKRYYYRRKAERDALNLLLDSLPTPTDPPRSTRELEEWQIQAQLSEVDDAFSPFLNAACTPDSTRFADEVLACKEEAPVVAAQPHAVLRYASADSGSNISTPAARDDPGFRQSHCDVHAVTRFFWSDLLPPDANNGSSLACSRS
ncbi:hypothetical protein PHBOTO_004348 [Pseudozyma hubeiensis]|nr:hypothetical protein PHBOTO_004348 [Pseudozyma hubeiensis]